VTQVDRRSFLEAVALPENWLEREQREGVGNSVRTPGIAVAVIFVLAAPALAHPAPFSFVDLRLTDRSIGLTVVAHIFDLAHDLGIDPSERLLDPSVAATRQRDIVALVTSRVRLNVAGQALDCQATSAPEVLRDRQSIAVHFTCPTSGPTAAVGIRTVMFPYDPIHQTFLNIYEGPVLATQAILDRDHDTFEYFAGTPQGTFAVVRKFVVAGVRHILIGPDHLLFLIGLLLLGGTLRQLAVVVTAFTLAHSLTLSLAVLSLVTPPKWIIEPAIALSIVYVGADNLLARGARDVRAWIAFGFGFIHGFGFANVLREMDLPGRALGWSLCSFNVGVELGQLTVVIVVASGLAALRARSPSAGRRVVVVGSICVMVAGTFWFVQRVFFLK
jgi:hydrogenase/urease accessory protein HupE